MDYHWNISADTIHGRALSELKKLDKGSSSISSGMSLNFLFDNRQNSANPQNGSCANIRFRFNSKFLGSNENWNSLMMDFRHYIPFPATTKNVLAFWSYNNLTLNGTPPYLDLPSIGLDDYSNTGRGYVAGRYTGRNLLYLESEYRFVLTQNGLLGGVVFGNAESIIRKTTSNINTIIPGYGLGIRVKVNKHSNVNVAIDYGFGIGGSQGFFFNVGEVF
jgi:outer membrane protein assembly factor BamA